jgi:hypothetical protein
MIMSVKVLGGIELESMADVWPFKLFKRKEGFFVETGKGVTGPWLTKSEAKSAMTRAVDRLFDLQEKENMSQLSFEQELSALLNRHSVEKESGTPDFLLAEYLQNCLTNYNETVKKRAFWRGESTELTTELLSASETSSEYNEYLRLKDQADGEQSHEDHDRLEELKKIFEKDKND